MKHVSCKWVPIMLTIMLLAHPACAVFAEERVEYSDFAS